jgi:release factor glutamine methyltransferase
LTDIDDDTLAMAKKNFSIYFPSPNFSIDFFNSSLLDFLDDKEIDLSVFDSIVLVSNAPYIPDDTLDTEVEENVKKREPRIALVGGKDGLDLYRILLRQIVKKLPQIQQMSIFFEMMTWQCDILRGEFEDQFTFDEVKTFHANIRIVRCTIVN